jgi:hypothetical protein
MPAQVPLLGMSRLVQRMLDVERRRAESWKERALSAEAMLEGAAAGACAGSGKQAQHADDSPGTKQKKVGEC